MINWWLVNLCLHPITAGIGSSRPWVQVVPLFPLQRRCRLQRRPVQDCKAFLLKSHQPALQTFWLFSGLQRKQPTGWSSCGIVLLHVGELFHSCVFHSRISAAVINDSNPLMAASHLEESVYCAWAGFSTQESYRINRLDASRCRESRVWYIYIYIFKGKQPSGSHTHTQNLVQVKATLAEDSALHAEGWMYGLM